MSCWPIGVGEGTQGTGRISPRAWVAGYLIEQPLLFTIFHPQRYFLPKSWDPHKKKGAYDLYGAENPLPYISNGRVSGT